LTDLGKIWYGDAYYASKYDRQPKISKFQDLRRRMPAILKIKNRDISETIWPILTKFARWHILVLQRLPAVEKTQTFKNTRWRTILKIVKCVISATV